MGCSNSNPEKTRKLIYTANITNSQSIYLKRRKTYREEPRSLIEYRKNKLERQQNDNMLQELHNAENILYLSSQSDPEIDQFNTDSPFSCEISQI